MDLLILSFKAHIIVFFYFILELHFELFYLIFHELEWLNLWDIGIDSGNFTSFVNVVDQIRSVFLSLHYLIYQFWLFLFEVECLHCLVGSWLR